MLHYAAQHHLHRLRQLSLEAVWQRADPRRFSDDESRSFAAARFSSISRQISIWIDPEATTGRSPSKAR